MSDLESLVKNKALFRILVVDDKANMRRTLRNMLRMMGFNNFNDAEDGDVALKKIKSEKFDFVICDWNMPRMNGVELLKAIREDDRFKNLPFLMITAEVEEGTVAESIEAEVDGYILKPFVPKTLEDKIIEILTRKQSPSQVETFLLAAETLIKSGAYNRAMEEVNKAARISPRSPKVHYYKGLILEGAGDMAEAEKSYIQAERSAPSSSRPTKSWPISTRRPAGPRNWWRWSRKRSRFPRKTPTVRFVWAKPCSRTAGFRKPTWLSTTPSESIRPRKEKTSSARFT